MIFKNKVFDVLKWLCLLAIPAFASAYASLASGLGLPYADEVSLIANVVCTLLGTLLGISNYQYYHSDTRELNPDFEPNQDEDNGEG